MHAYAQSYIFHGEKSFTGRFYSLETQPNHIHIFVTGQKERKESAHHVKIAYSAAYAKYRHRLALLLHEW
jgi:hypothetical protein